jgi:predicted dehydrogenase
MSRPIHRRRFLQSSAGAAAAAYFVNPIDASQPARNERVRVAIVGVNAQGAWNLDQVVGSGLAEIVALCDVDAARSANQVRRFPKARFHEDYRRMFDQQRDIDAVLIATPDHHHAPAAMTALRAGKHVYCEKPLAHSVHEVRTMMREAARRRVVTQMGTQIHNTGDNYRRVVEIIQAGTLGPVRRVHVWNAGRPVPGRRVREAQPVPRGLNYDLWLGPAPQQSYPPFRTGDSTSPHFHWRWWWDFGGGVLADLGCHYMDLPHWALNLRQPTTVAATGRKTYQGDNTVPDILQVDYEYPARGSQPPVHLTWYHGVRGPDLAGNTVYDGFASGILFEGERGNLLADYGRHRLLPEDRFRDFQPPRPTIARSPGHHREWLQAILNNDPHTTCDFDYSGALTETVLLGNVAYRAGGGKLQYDAATGRLTGNGNAEQYLRREYRQGWTL